MDRAAARTFLRALVASVAFGAAAHGALADEALRAPTLDDLLNLRQARGAVVSPDGRYVAYSVTQADFEQDAFVTRLWVATSDGARAFQLTTGEKSATSPRWSPDGRWLAFLSGRAGDKDQIFVISPEGGEAVRLTRAEEGVEAFAWSRDGRQIAFRGQEADSQAKKDRKAYLGDYEVVRRDHSYRQLFTLDVAEALKSPVLGIQRTKGGERSVGDFDWSPDGATIAFSATTTPDLIQGTTADIYLLKLADGSVTPLVRQPGPDTNPTWSPDGRSIAFSSQMGRTRYFAANSRIAVVPAAGGAPRSLTDAFDEDTNILDWNEGGLFFEAAQRTASHLFRLDPETGAITRVSGPDDLMASSFSVSRDGRRVAFAAASPTTLTEVFVSAASPFAPRKLTDMTAQTKPLLLGSREIATWKSQDGTTIEGVLVKPAGFDPSRKHPLLVVIHGGPTGIDRPTLLDPRYYPSDIWAARDAVILKVNYRGSAGYGEKFRQLNWRNLGVGDAWDVLSGVDSLIAKGWVDPARMGCMGWSQGGYISAFLTTSTTRFAAVSVGAGISNWATYYYNTDITPFTIQYLGAHPAEDPEIYRKTSPMTYINKAHTPTLIQHGENDRRVPIPNAYELRQGLEDRGVPVEMIVYKGFPHGITKPKAMRAVMRHNLEWFGHYLWGDPLPDWTHPDVPKKEKDKDDKTAEEGKKAE
jgi:dipeptidyl aminopeptidase/acylaminoacyl peptidase